MHNLEIEFEWQDPGGAKGEELRHDMGVIVDFD